MDRNIRYPKTTWPQMTTAERLASAPSNGYVVYDTTLGQPFQYVAGAWVAIYPQTGGSVLPLFQPVLADTMFTYSITIDGTAFTFGCGGYSGAGWWVRSNPFWYPDGADTISLLTMSPNNETKGIYWGVVGGAVGESRTAHSNGRGATTGKLNIAYTANQVIKTTLSGGLNNFSDGDIINATIYSVDAPTTTIYVLGWLLEET